MTVKVSQKLSLNLPEATVNQLLNMKETVYNSDAVTVNHGKKSYEISTDGKKNFVVSYYKKSYMSYVIVGSFKLK